MARTKPRDPERQVVEASLLLDTYGKLLTERQRDFTRLHFEEDLSFSEIARNHEISRQAVHDSVKHAIQTLRTYEDALGLVAKAHDADEHPEPHIGGHQLIDRLLGLRQRVVGEAGQAVPAWVVQELESLITLLGGDGAGQGPGAGERPASPRPSDPQDTGA